ncbi:MAG: hypothetical protein DME26_12885 [Verrucomicrobia bacterium]|nr:MAG: hypothetical protein DME26_12885 [Verrucomicrobiota bacterium]
MSFLSRDLFRVVRPGFFRVLAGMNAAAYLDVLDALEREAAERHEGMSREEALALSVRRYLGIRALRLSKTSWERQRIGSQRCRCGTKHDEC